MRLILVILAVTFLSGAAHAQSLLETQQEARQRHNAENYQQYERNNKTAPLGGYNERLGDPSPPGTERPGYVSPQPYGNNYNSGYQPQNNSRNRY